MSTESQLATAALDTLHGARDSSRLADASRALRTLVSRLETGGAATDDDWGSAIQTMFSFTNKTS